MDLLMNVVHIQFYVVLKHTHLFSIQCVGKVQSGGTSYIEQKFHNFALTSKRLRLPGLGLLDIPKYPPWQGESHTRMVLSMENKMLGEKRSKLGFVYMT